MKFVTHSFEIALLILPYLLASATTRRLKRKTKSYTRLLEPKPGETFQFDKETKLDIIQRLGKGTTGEVFSAIESSDQDEPVAANTLGDTPVTPMPSLPTTAPASESLKPTYALKFQKRIVHPVQKSILQKRIAILQKIMEIQKTVKDKRIMKVYKFQHYKNEKSFAILSELFSHKTLSDYLGGKPELDIKKEFLPIAKCIINVMALIHKDYHMIYMDFKPDNLVIVDDHADPCRLIDFDSVLDKKQEVEKVRGFTPAFAPPGIVNGREYPIKELERTDHIGVGMTLAIMLWRANFNDSKVMADLRDGLMKDTKAYFENTINEAKFKPEDVAANKDSLKLIEDLMVGLFAETPANFDSLAKKFVGLRRRNRKMHRLRRR